MNFQENRGNDQRGSILIEAAMTIPVFIFTVISLILVIIPCIGQAKVANAMNEAAYDFSQNYYLRSASSDGVRQGVESFVEYFSESYWSVAMPNSDLWDTTNIPVQNAPQIASKMVPKHLGIPIGHSQSSNNLTAVDKELRRYGIRGGTSGLDFSLSSYYYPTNTMTFVVKYTIYMPHFPFVGDIHFDVTKASTSTLWSRD